MRGRKGGGRWRGNGSKEKHGPGKIHNCPESPGKAKRSRPLNKTKRFLLPKQVHFMAHPQKSSGVNFASISLAEGPRERKVSPIPLYCPQAESQCSAKWFKKQLHLPHVIGSCVKLYYNCFIKLNIHLFCDPTFHF